MSYSFTVFGEDWGRHPSSTQHIFKHMIREHDIHWINSIGMRSPKLCVKDIGRIFEKGSSYFKKNGVTVVTRTKPKVYQPKLLPFHGSRFVQFLNKKLFQPQSTSVLWTSLPTSVYLHDNLKPSCTVYYCGDDFGALDGVDHKMVAIHEKNLAEQADIIFTINKNLARKFPYPKTYILDHGVDYELFSTPQERPKDLPHRKKIAGFYGSIQSWLDLDLIEGLAKELSDWTFVFIGVIHVDVSALKTYSNIYFLGSKEHHELPAYVQHWNVSLLPFKNTKQIEACNPLKLKEYMTAGSPIVSTRFPAVEVFEGLVHVTDKEGFSKAIKAALSEERGQKNIRQAIMKQHSWEVRAQYVQDIISTHLMA